MDLKTQFPSFEKGFMVNPFDHSSTYSIINAIDQIDFESPVYDHFDPKQNNQEKNTNVKEILATMSGMVSVGREK
jgi:hypothetical protein